ncbi:hypothetical protein [Litoreibacter halocynthiae]|uniref:hypothetical protein n=1 Tax=Litoreibacter halocynthiae TaxID=1242689 RepID=UPI0024913A47|nr:hypothetical protein [Litoreibacter halocynthiae]
MRTSISRAAFTAIITTVLSSAAVAAQTEQRNCRFTLATKSDGQQADVDWKVAIANKDSSGRVVVTGSGDYKAKAKKFKSGAMEFSFKTEVSKENITIGAKGEALWDIQFKNGDFLAYFGTCSAAKVTS